MQYDPKEAKSLTVPPGDYEASLVTCDETVTKLSNLPMAVLNWRVYPSGDMPSFLQKDYIVLSGEKNGLWKLKKIAIAFDALEKFDDATFDPKDYIGSNLIVTLKIKAADDKYPESNAITAYKPLKKSEIKKAIKEVVKRSEKDAGPPEFADANQNDDDIPF